MRQLWDDIRKNAASAIAPTVMAGLVYLLNYFVFGPANTITAPFVTLSYLRLRQLRFHPGALVKQLAVYLLLALVSWAAVRSAVLCLLLNAAALFWIGDVLIDEYEPNNYLSSVMALGLFQLSPAVTPAELGLRLLSLCASFALIALFAFVPRLIRPQPSALRQRTEEGLALSGTLTAAEDDALETHRALRALNHALSMEIWSENRSALRRRNRVNWYCRFVAAFQVVNFLTAPENPPEDRESARQILAGLHREFEGPGPELQFLRLRIRDHRPDLRSFRLRFALRLTLVGTPCLLFRQLSALPNTYWFVISVFTMMIPFTDETQTRVRQRVVGSFVGLLLCFALYSLIPDLAGHLVIMLIANFFVYASGSYGARVAFITCSAMAAQTVDVILPAVLGQRMLYTLAGAAVALLANRFVFRVRASKQIEYLRGLLRDIRKALPAAEDRRRRDELLIKSYLLSHRILALNDALPEGERLPDLPAAERAHMRYLAEYLLSEEE